MNDVLNEENESSSVPSNIRDKDINDMVLSGHKVQEIVESNTYSGLQTKTQIYNLEKDMSGDLLKVTKRNGSVEKLDLDKMHKMVDEAN